MGAPGREAPWACDEGDRSGVPGQGDGRGPALDAVTSAGLSRGQPRSAPSPHSEKVLVWPPAWMGPLPSCWSCNGPG